MEIKKSRKADLERKRPLGFLIGIVVALVAFVVAIEYSFDEYDEMFDSDFLDEIAEDMDFMPPVVNSLPEPEPLTPNQSDQIEVVENAKEDSPDDKEKEEQKLLVETELVEEPAEEPEEPEEEPEKQEEVKSLGSVDQLPQFPGGMAKLMKWRTTNLRYPETAKRAKVGGKVVVEFIVNADGSVSDVRLVKNSEAVFDREVLRVMGMMPKWEPGRCGNKNCRTLVQMPVVFKL